MHTLRAAAPRRSAKAFRDCSQTFLLRKPMITDNSHTFLKLRTRPGNHPPPEERPAGRIGESARRFSHNEVHPYDEVDWTRRNIRIMDWKTGKTIYERLGLEAPAHWDHTTPSGIRGRQICLAANPAPWSMKTASAIFTTTFNPCPVWGWGGFLHTQGRPGKF